MIRGEEIPTEKNINKQNQNFLTRPRSDMNTIKWIIIKNLNENIKNEYKFFNICPICLTKCQRSDETPLLIPPDNFPKILFLFHPHCAGKIHPNDIVKNFNFSKDLAFFMNFYGQYHVQNSGNYSLRIYLNLEFQHPFTQKNIFKSLIVNSMFFNENSRNWEFHYSFKDSKNSFYDLELKFLPFDFYSLKVEMDIPYYRAIYFRKYFIQLEGNLSQNIGCFYVDLEPGNKVYLILKFAQAKLENRNLEEKLIMSKFGVEEKENLPGWLIEEVVVYIPEYVIANKNTPNHFPQTTPSECKYIFIR